ncbi:MAG: hypothetical protein ACRCUM_01325 [Mycoplasmoidaceae bacterium]
MNNKKFQPKFHGILPKLLTSLKGEEKKNYFRVVLNLKNSAASYENESKDKLKVYLPKPALPQSLVSDLKERDISYFIIVNKEECGSFEKVDEEDDGSGDNRKTLLVLNKNKNYVLKRENQEKSINGLELFNFLKDNNKVYLWDWTPKDFEDKIYSEDLIPDNKKEEYFTIRILKIYAADWVSKNKEHHYLSFPKKLMNEKDRTKHLHIDVLPADVKSYFYINKENGEKTYKYSILINKNQTYSFFNSKKDEYDELKMTGMEILNNDVEKNFTRALWISKNKNEISDDLVEDIEKVFEAMDE